MAQVSVDLLRRIMGLRASSVVARLLRCYQISSDAFPRRYFRASASAIGLQSGGGLVRKL